MCFLNLYVLIHALYDGDFYQKNIGFSFDEDNPSLFVITHTTIFKLITCVVPVRRRESTVYTEAVDENTDDGQETADEEYKTIFQKSFLDKLMTCVLLCQIINSKSSYSHQQTH